VLLQAMANAFLNGWVVINIPEGEHLASPCPPPPTLGSSGRHNGDQIN
jgi:hypothetical protein